MYERHFDAIVIGGGIVGASAAYHLNMYGAKTLLVDRADRGRATDAGAGILAPELSLHPQEAWFDFAVEAVAYYPHMVARLNRECGGDTSFTICGMLLVATTDDEAEEVEAARKLILERQQRRGSPLPADLHPVEPCDAKEMFPALGDVRHALYYRNAARVDGRMLSSVLCKAGELRGMQILHGNVESFVLRGDRVTGVVVDDVLYPSGTTVITGGAWSPAMAAQVGCTIPVAPQRGQIAHLELPGVETNQWPIVMGLAGHYLLTWPQSQVVVGATRENGSGFDPNTTVEGIHEVLGQALRLAPGLKRARFNEMKVGLRPVTPDGLPIICEVPGLTGLHMAVGHGPTGLQLGPYSGAIVAKLALNAPHTVDLSAFHISRFDGVDVS
ncbi:MAG: FAD-dependent oxidoreductase [Caldilineaceae bacterium]|nr:FAD-dependent oxidoreductase [Caldilineaceae bacterium]